jgi:kinetochore protein Mis13/DSN1
VIYAPCVSSHSFNPSFQVVNGEEQPGGLIIVPTHSRPPSTQPQPQPPLPPPTKKFKASSSTKTSRLSHRPPIASTSTAPPANDDEMDEAVRQMDFEADSLRRQSQSHAKASGKSVNGQFRFPESPPRDGWEPVKERETPQIEKNKMLRWEGVGSGRSPGGVGRRKSSMGGRGKRISSSFETTGVISEFVSRSFHLNDFGVPYSIIHHSLLLSSFIASAFRPPLSFFCITLTTPH